MSAATLVQRSLRVWEASLSGVRLLSNVSTSRTSAQRTLDLNIPTGRTSSGNARKLVEDMKRSLEPKSQPWHLRDDRPHIALQDSLNLDAHVVDGFVARAKQGMPHFNFEENVEVFYWVAKCLGSHPSQISDGLDEEFLLTYTKYIKAQASFGLSTVKTLNRALRTFSDLLNKNRVAMALEGEAQALMEEVTHSLLEASMQRLQRRHQHLSLGDLTQLLAVFARLFRPSYMPLFESAASYVEDFAADGRIARSEKWRHDFFKQIPFTLMAYAKVKCSHEAVFSSCMQVLESNLSELEYDGVALVAWAVATVAVDRPRLWPLIIEEVRDLPHRWSIHAFGLLLAAARRELLRIDKNAGHRPALLELASLVSQDVLKRPNQVSFHEATEILGCLAVCPVYFIKKHMDVLQLACTVVVAIPGEFPPSYLPGNFRNIVALQLLLRPAMAEAGVLQSVEAATRALLIELELRQYLCDPTDMEDLADVLWTLARELQGCPVEKVRGCFAAVARVPLGTFVLVQQREAIRNSAFFGSHRLVQIASLIARTATVLEQVAADPDKKSAMCAGAERYTECWLRTWFLPDVLEFVAAQDSAGEMPEDVHALVKSVETNTPIPVAEVCSLPWLTDKIVGTDVPLVLVYGARRTSTSPLLDGWEGSSISQA